jgi:hypothetical protein
MLIQLEELELKCKCAAEIIKRQFKVKSPRICNTTSKSQYSFQWRNMPVAGSLAQKSIECKPLFTVALKKERIHFSLKSLAQNEALAETMK